MTTKINLYKVAYCAVGIDEEIVELARAHSFMEAANVVRDFMLETYQDNWADCKCVTVQLLHEPEGIGIIHELAGCEQTFVIDNGRLKPITETKENP